MSCSRLTRSHRPCRIGTTDWPAYDDLPAPVAACWTHLTDREREQCMAARARRNQENRRRYEQLVEELAARGESEPEQVYREERPCIGRCITKADLWDRENPGRYYDHSDSAMIDCAHCDHQVCILCRDRDHAMGAPCTSPSDIVSDELPSVEDQEPYDGPNPRAYLNSLVAQLARVTGERHSVINARINRAAGVASRVGAEEALIRRAAGAARTWLTIEESATGRGSDAPAV